jgi:hypothetical protein
VPNTLDPKNIGPKFWENETEISLVPNIFAVITFLTPQGYTNRFSHLNALPQ